MPTAEEIAASKEKEAAEKKAEEADKALEERIAKIANAALTSHFKRQKPGLTAEDLEKWAEARDAKKAELDEEKKKAAAGGGSGAGGANNAPEIAKLQKELADLKKKGEAAEARAAEVEKKQKDAEDKATITKTLEAAGVPAGQRARVALNHLLSEGLVKRNGDELVFVDAKGNEQDLADGITNFLKSEDGKLFLPASGAGGSGERGVRGGGSGSGKKMDPRARAGAALVRMRSGTGE